MCLLLVRRSNHFTFSQAKLKAKIPSQWTCRGHPGNAGPCTRLNDFFLDGLDTVSPSNSVEAVVFMWLFLYSHTIDINLLVCVRPSNSVRICKNKFSLKNNCRKGTDRHSDPSGVWANRRLRCQFSEWVCCFCTHSVPTLCYCVSQLPLCIPDAVGPAKIYLRKFVGSGEYNLVLIQMIPLCLVSSGVFLHGVLCTGRMGTRVEKRRGSKGMTRSPPNVSCATHASSLLSRWVFIMCK